MIKYIKNYFKKRREFKKSIKGIFDDWVISESGTYLENKDYAISHYAGDCSTLFQGDIFDMTYSRNFIDRFNKWEQGFLLKEALKATKSHKDRHKLCLKNESMARECKITKARKAINKEFNLK